MKKREKEMNLADLINRKPPEPWTGCEKIPWHEPDFSRRMLESHLSQDHDWATGKDFHEKLQTFMCRK